MRLDKELSLPLNATQQLDSFVVEPINQYAVQKARELVGSSLATTNAFVVKGDRGTGKTHLLNAMGNALRIRNPDSRVLFTTAQLLAQVHDAAEELDNMYSLENFLTYFNTIIIDDLSALKNKLEVQAFLFDVFRHYQKCNRQIILATEEMPRRIENYGPFISFLGRGTVVTLKRTGQLMPATTDGAETMKLFDDEDVDWQKE